MYCDDIFRLIYQFHPETEHARQVSIAAFIYAWKNINKLPENKNFYHWLREISIIRSVYHFKKENKFEKENIFIEDHSKNISHTKLETIALNLDDCQRIALFLYTRIGFSIDRISKLLGNVPHYKVTDYLAEAFEKLSSNSILQNIHGMKEQGFRILLNCEADGDLSQSNFEKSTIREYPLFKKEISGLFFNVKVPEDLVPVIAEKLESIEQHNQKSIASENEKVDKKEKIENQIENETIIALKRTIAEDTTLKEYKRTELKRKVTRILFFIFSVTIIYAVYYGLNYYSNVNSPWSVLGTGGEYNINGTINQNKLNEGETLETGPSSECEITIPNTGSFLLGENSDLTLIRGFNGKNIVNTGKGIIHYKSFKQLQEQITFSDVPSLTINIPAGKLKTEICDLELSLRNKQRIIVKTGWTKIELRNEKLYLATGYYYDLLSQLPVPLHINHLSIYENNFTDVSSLLLDMKDANDYDTLTLWHLIKLVGVSDRHTVIDKLKEFYPFIIDDQFYEELIYLNSDALEIMLETIKWHLLFE